MRQEERGNIERHIKTGGGDREKERAMEGMIMSGNICLSIRIWTPINNMLSQSTA